MTTEEIERILRNLEKRGRESIIDTFQKLSPKEKTEEFLRGTLDGQAFSLIKQLLKKETKL